MNTLFNLKAWLPQLVPSLLQQTVMMQWLYVLLYPMRQHNINVVRIQSEQLSDLATRNSQVIRLRKLLNDEFSFTGNIAIVDDGPGAFIIHLPVADNIIGNKLIKLRARVNQYRVAGVQFTETYV